MRKLSFAGFCAALTICVNTNIFAATPTVDSYISKYRLIAQLESFRSGIPTSIILAQGILESGYGNSQLASKSNNHFGIKWKSKNDGDFVYSYDDDYDKSGKHIPSKFVKYSNVEKSYQHHTDFLMHRAHYKPLFKLKPNDFVSWAYGLKACGYSTDQQYGVQLIHLIRRYKLYEYDLLKSKGKNINPTIVSNTKKLVNIFKERVVSKFTFLKTQSEIVEANDKKVSEMPKFKRLISSISDSPIHPDNHDNDTQNMKWAFFKSLISSRYWLG